MDRQTKGIPITPLSFRSEGLKIYKSVVIFSMYHVLLRLSSDAVDCIEA